MLRTLLQALDAALDEAHLPYMLVGGQAMLRYGEPRLTPDVDVLVGVDLDHLPALQRAARVAELRPLVVPEEFTVDTGVLPCEHRPSGFRVDFMLCDTPYVQQALGRAQGVCIVSRVVRYASLEDLIIQKLIAGRPRDVEDVRVLLLKHDDVDATYLRQWLAALDNGNGGSANGLCSGFEALWQATR